MNLQVKYFLARLGIFLLCAFPAFLLLPDSMDPLLKLLIALVASAVISFFVLRTMAEQAGESWLAHRQRRREERARLRATLAGEEDPSSGGRGPESGDSPQGDDDHR